MRNNVACFALSALVALCSVSAAEQASSVHKLGYLGGGLGIENREEMLRERLGEIGYIEGRNLVFEWRFAKGEVNRFPELATELVHLKPEIIITSGTQAARALKNATATIPIVSLSAGDLIGRGLVASLARPGGNITGLTTLALDLNSKRLEIIKEIVPGASRIAFLYQAHEKDEARELEISGRTLGVSIQQHEVSQPGEFQRAYDAMRSRRVGALLISRSPFSNSHRKELIELATKNRLPLMCDGAEWTNAGCLISYAFDHSEVSRRAAYYVDKILKGAKPADLPVEQPTKFELVINLKTAKQIGVTIPQSVLYRADKVIK